MKNPKCKKKCKKIGATCRSGRAVIIGQSAKTLQNPTAYAIISIKALPIPAVGGYSALERGRVYGYIQRIISILLSLNCSDHALRFYKEKEIAAPSAKRATIS